MRDTMQYPSQEFYRQVEHIKPGERKRTMNQREETEISQKLANLKIYQEQYDQAKHAMQRARNQAETLAHWNMISIILKTKQPPIIRKWHCKQNEILRLRLRMTGKQPPIIRKWHCK